MSNWDFDSNQGSAEKIEYVKFPVGETNIRVVGVAPHQRWTHWWAKAQRSINCPGKGCPICEIRAQQKASKITPTYAMAKRFSIWAINRTTGRLELMEQGKMFFEDLKEVKEILEKKGKKLIDADVRVKRKGSNKDDTTYRLDVSEEFELSDSDKKLIESVKPIEDLYSPNTPEQIIRLINGEEWDVVMYGDESEEAQEATKEEFVVK